MDNSKQETKAQEGLAPPRVPKARPLFWACLLPSSPPLCFFCRSQLNRSHDECLQSPRRQSTIVALMLVNCARCLVVIGGLRAGLRRCSDFRIVSRSDTTAWVPAPSMTDNRRSGGNNVNDRAKVRVAWAFGPKILEHLVKDTKPCSITWRTRF